MRKKDFTNHAFLFFSILNPRYFHILQTHTRKAFDPRVVNGDWHERSVGRRYFMTKFRSPDKAVAGRAGFGTRFTARREHKVPPLNLRPVFQYNRRYS